MVNQCERHSLLIFESDANQCTETRPSSQTKPRPQDKVPQCMHIMMVNLCERHALIIFERDKVHPNRCKETWPTSHTKPRPHDKVAQYMHIVQEVTLILAHKTRLINVCILYNECMEWEVKFEKARDRLNFSPSVGIEPTTTWLKATRSTG